MNLERFELNSDEVHGQDESVSNTNSEGGLRQRKGDKCDGLPDQDKMQDMVPRRRESDVRSSRLDFMIDNILDYNNGTVERD